MAEYTDEEMERMVEESKAIHGIVEFAHTEGVTESMEKVAAAVVILAHKFKTETELGHQEVVAALIGSLSGVLTAWAVIDSGGDVDA